MKRCGKTSASTLEDLTVWTNKHKAGHIYSRNSNSDCRRQKIHTNQCVKIVDLYEIAAFDIPNQYSQTEFCFRIQTVCGRPNTAHSGIFIMNFLVAYLYDRNYLLMAQFSMMKIAIFRSGIVYNKCVKDVRYHLRRMVYGCKDVIFLFHSN